MDKITSYMRVTKTRKTRDEKGVAHALHKAPPAAAASPASPAAKHALPTSTSPVEQQQEPHDEDGGHIPEFIYRVVKYVRKGQSEKPSKEVLNVVKHIETHFRIPPDFERSHKYGPHSGLTFERRLMKAYSLKLLELKNPEKNPLPEAICVTCAQLGHSRHGCPDGF